ncbi:MAG: hypothetical protein JWP25_7402 [Bradyrhizobium sp.]|jgi:hypothetical protein|nr:hypothetical protein [Bradyrhizobium sp.]
MTNLSSNASVAIDPSTPFCARTYYAALRDLGVDSIVVQKRDGGLGEYRTIGANNGVGDTSPFHTWVMNGDPDQSLCREHAIAAWENRAGGQEVLLLGV